MDITVNNFEEFENLTQVKDIRIAKAILEAITVNIKGKKRSIPFLSVNVLSEGIIYNLSIDRKNFLVSLEEIIYTFEEHEMYEECIQIRDMIKSLSK